MQHTRSLLLTAVLFTLLALPFLLAGCNSASNHPGRAAFERACSRCHKISRPLAKAKDRQGWQRTVNVMRKRGASLNEEEAKLVVDYLMEVRGANK